MLLTTPPPCNSFVYSTDEVHWWNITADFLFKGSFSVFFSTFLSETVGPNVCVSEKKQFCKKHLSKHDDGGRRHLNVSKYLVTDRSDPAVWSRVDWGRAGMCDVYILKANTDSGAVSIRPDVGPSSCFGSRRTSDRRGLCSLWTACDVTAVVLTQSGRRRGEWTSRCGW